MNALVNVIEGRAMADSRDVAARFGKEHRNVARSIETLIEQRGELLLNFEQQLFPVQQGNGALREYRRFDMDRKGFMLLVMGFTGAKALDMKIQWIDAFDQMEAALIAAAAPAIEGDAPVEHLDRWQFVREARLLGGVAAGRRAWRLAGLPEIFTPEVGAARDAGAIGDPLLAAWLEERTEFDPLACTYAGELHLDYKKFVEQHGGTAKGPKYLARHYRAFGLTTRKSSLSIWNGIRIRGAN